MCQSSEFCFIYTFMLSTPVLLINWLASERFETFALKKLRVDSGREGDLLSRIFNLSIFRISQPPSSEPPKTFSLGSLLLTWSSLDPSYRSLTLNIRTLVHQLPKRNGAIRETRTTAPTALVTSPLHRSSTSSVQWRPLLLHSKDPVVERNLRSKAPGGD